MTGCITDPEGLPLNLFGVGEVFVAPIGPRGDRPPRAYDHKEWGRYAATELTPGRYRVTARLDGYQGESKVVTVGEDAPIVLDFVLRPADGSEDATAAPD